MITKQELEKLKELAGKYSKCLNLLSEEVTPSSWFNIKQSILEFREEANPDTVLRLIEALEVATDSLSTAHENACECCNSRDRVKDHCDEAISKIYGE